MRWTDDKIETLRRMWMAGATGGEISERLGASRSSVIAKAHRLGLPGRESPVARRMAGVSHKVPYIQPKIARLRQHLTAQGLKRDSIDGVMEALSHSWCGTPGQVAIALGLSKGTVVEMIRRKEAEYGWQAA